MLCTPPRFFPQSSSYKRKKEGEKRPSHYNLPALITISNSHTLEIGIRQRGICIHYTREQFPAIFHSILDEWCDSYHLRKPVIRQVESFFLRAHCMFIRTSLPQNFTACQFTYQSLKSVAFHRRRIITSIAVHRCFFFLSSDHNRLVQRKRVQLITGN